MKATKAISLILAAIMTATVFASCAENAETGNESVVTEAVTEAETEDELAGLTDMEKRAYLKDSLPEENFNGADFRISYYNGVEYEITTEEEDGEILNDALYARNRTVEERFGVKIVGVACGGCYDQPGIIRQTISSGDDAYELCSSMVFLTGPIIIEGYYLNWLNMEYNDFSQPWWIGGVNDCFRIGDAIYAATGDMCVSTLKLTYGIYYNRTQGENYNLGGVYDEIRSGNWTIDRFTDIVHAVYSDLNGNGKADDDDFYGFTAEALTNLDIYSFAFGIPITEKDADGIPQLVFNNEKTITAVDKVLDLYYGGEGSHISSAGVETNIFKAGNCLFTTSWLGHAYGNFRDMKDDYSILPYPKYDENQEKYLTGAMDNYSVLGAPITTKTPEMISLITEALNIESYKTLFPTYYEQALQNKYARDVESIEMIDILMQGRNFDLVTLFSANIPGMSTLFRGVVSSKKNNFASKYASTEKGAVKGLEKVLEAYQANASK